MPEMSKEEIELRSIYRSKSIEDKADLLHLGMACAPPAAGIRAAMSRACTAPACPATDGAKDLAWLSCAFCVETCEGDRMTYFDLLILVAIACVMFR